MQFGRAWASCSGPHLALVRRAMEEIHVRTSDDFDETDSAGDNRQSRGVPLRYCGLSPILFHGPLRHWFRGRYLRAEDHRQRVGGTLGRSSHNQSFAYDALRATAQRDGTPAVQAAVDAICAAVSGTQHLCSVCEPRADLVVLAVAADAGRGLADRRSADCKSVVLWLVLGAHVDLPHQPFRVV